MNYTIAPFPYTDQAYEHALRLRNQLHADEPSSPAIWRYWDTVRSADALFERLLASDAAGRLVAYGQIESTAPTHDKFAMTIEMAPESWSTDLPEALYWRLTALTSPYDPVRLTITAREDESAKIAFLGRHGFDRVLRSPVFYLDVPSFDPTPYWPLLDRLRRDGLVFRQPPPGWQRQPSWQGRIYDLYWTLLQDTPHYEPRTRPPLSRFVRAELEHPNFLPGGIFLVWDGDQPIGMSSLVKRGGATEVLGVGLTGVLHSYRRRGLATVLKVLAIQFARSLNARLIITDNEEKNPMHLLNQRLGFTPRPAWTHWQKQTA